MKSPLSKTAFLAALVVSAGASANLRLQIDPDINTVGDEIALTGPGGLDMFQYRGSGTSLDVELRTYFGDLRCVEPTMFPAWPGSGAQLQLDRVIKIGGVESEARYDLSAVESITYEPSKRLVSINFDGATDPACVHEIPAVGAISADGTADPGAFWISGFDPLFDVAFSIPAGGSGFRMQVANRSETEPLRAIQVFFTAAVGNPLTDFAPEIGSVDPGAQSGDWIWTIPLLWPQGAQEDRAFIDIVNADLAAGIEVDRIESLTRDSFPDTSPLLTTVVNTSTAR